MKDLTKSQKEKLAKHGKHHTKKHIEMMKRYMLKGLTFTQAHEKTIKLVGK
tara:strand:+ start:10703 stop:10855 length:153 start_codon:yes stop_codon:yes gene_type:complete